MLLMLVSHLGRTSRAAQGAFADCGIIGPMPALLVLPFLLSGLFFSPNVVLMSYGGGNTSPFWYGVWGNLGIGVVALVAGLVCLSGTSWRWSTLFRGEVSAWPLVITALSRVCYSFFLTAGYFVDYGVVAVLGAVFPVGSLMFGWFFRRGTESPQSMSASTWVLAVVGFSGAGLAILSQSSGGGLHVLNDPVMAVFGTLLVLLAAIISSLQVYGLRFWAMSRSSLVRVDGFPPLVCRAAFAPCFLSCAVGAFMISGLSLVPALMLGLPVVNPWIALGSGTLVGCGIVLWALGVMVCRSSSAHLLLYGETLVGLALLWFSGLSPDLDWPMLSAGCVLLVGSGLWSGFSELRRQAHP